MQVSAPERDRTGRFVDCVVLAGLAVALALMPLAYDRAAHDPFTTPKRVVFGVAMTALLVVAWTARLRPGIAGSRSLVCLALLFLAALVSASRAQSPILALEGLRDLVFLAVPAAALGCAVLTSPRRVLLCANALGVGAFLVAVVGIMQHQGLDWWGFRPSIDAARGSGPAPAPDLLAAPIVGSMLRAVYGALDSMSRGESGIGGPIGDWLRGRPFARLPTIDGPASAFGHPNVAAEVVATGFVALVVAARAAWARAGSGLTRALAVGGLAWRLFALATMAFYLAVTGTRGAWVGLLAAATVLTASFVVQAPPGRRRARIAVVLIGLLVAGGAGFFAAQRIGVAARGAGSAGSTLDRVTALFRKADPARDTIQERRTLWANTHAMLAGSRVARPDRVLLGVGPGNWQVEYPLFHRDERRHVLGTYTLQRYPDHPHQDALEFVADHGLIGAALIAVFLGVVISTLASAMGRETGGGRYAALALLAILVVVGTVSLFSFPLHLAPCLVIGFLACGAALVAGDAAIRPPSRALAVAAAGLLFAGMAGLAGARGGAIAAATVALVSAGAVRLLRVRAGTVACAGAALLVLGACTYSLLRPKLGVFDALVAIVGCGVVALAALPLDRSVVWKGAAARALVIASVIAFAVSALGGAARLQASEDFQAAGDHALGARLIPSEAARATGLAREGYDRATAANPADFLGEMGRADFLNRAGLLVESEAAAMRVLRIHPWLINARVELAWLHLKRNDDEAAMQEARVARSLNPDAVEPHLLVGELFLRQGRTELGAGEFDRAVELSPKRIQPFAKVRAAEVRMSEGRDLTGALRHMEEAEREAAEDPEVLARIAALYSASDAPPEFHAKAARIWNRVLALNPVDVRARFFVAIAPLLASEPSREDLERILGTLDGIISSDPEFEPSRVRYFRALALERLGRPEEAARGYRDVMMLTAVAPFRRRSDDAGLDAAIEAMRALGAARAESRTAPASREEGR